MTFLRLCCCGDVEQLIYTKSQNGVLIVWHFRKWAIFAFAQSWLRIHIWHDVSYLTQTRHKVLISNLVDTSRYIFIRSCFALFPVSYSKFG